MQAEAIAEDRRGRPRGPAAAARVQAEGELRVLQRTVSQRQGTLPAVLPDLHQIQRRCGFARRRPVLARVQQLQPAG